MYIYCTTQCYTVLCTMYVCTMYCTMYCTVLYWQYRYSSLGIGLYTFHLLEAVMYTFKCIVMHEIHFYTEVYNAAPC